MAETGSTIRTKLPKRFEELVRQMPPHAIRDEADCDNAVEMVDRLMASGRLSKGQALYMETLVQLIQVWESEHEPVVTSDLSGLDSLKHLLEQNDLNASDLGRMLGMHPSMGSKILKGQRSLTVEHIRTLADRFGVSPELFL